MILKCPRIGIHLISQIGLKLVVPRRLIRRVSQYCEVGVYLKMSRSTVYWFQEDENSCPLKEWIDNIKPKKAQAKVIARILLLEELGHELRRPHADYLEDGIYELRERYKTNQYRILFFFAGKDIVILTHGLVKNTDEVPPTEIQRAKKFRQLYLSMPEKHTYEEGDDDE